MSRLASLSALLILLTGCAGSSLYTEFIPNPTHNLGDYKTFSWASPTMILAGELAGAGAPELRERLKAITAEEMAKKGYQLVERDQPHDMEVGFLVGTQSQTSYSAHNYTRNRSSYDATYIWTQANDVLRGALSMVVSNPENANDIYWQGTVSENIKDTRKPGANTQKFIEIVVAEMPQSGNAG